MHIYLSQQPILNELSPEDLEMLNRPTPHRPPMSDKVAEEMRQARLKREASLNDAHRSKDVVMDDHMSEHNLLLPKDMLQLIFEAAIIYHETIHEFGASTDEQYVTITANQLEELLLFEAGEWMGAPPPSVEELMSGEIIADLNLPEQVVEPQTNKPDLRMTPEELYLMLEQGEQEQLAGMEITEPDQWILERRKTHPLREASPSEVTVEQVEAALLAALAERAPLQDVTQLNNQSEYPRIAPQESVSPPDLSYLDSPSVTPRNLVSPEHAQRMFDYRMKHEASLKDMTTSSDPSKISMPDTHRSLK